MSIPESLIALLLDELCEEHAWLTEQLDLKKRERQGQPAF
jgi:hypothetical protein